nr:MAG TPA: hypothetical protein [Caudoviricetes sp.]
MYIIILKAEIDICVGCKRRISFFIVICSKYSSYWCGIMVFLIGISRQFISDRSTAQSICLSKKIRLFPQEFHSKTMSKTILIKMICDNFNSGFCFNYDSTCVVGIRTVCIFVS